MWRRLIVLALIVCAAGTGYFFGQVRDEPARAPRDVGREAVRTPEEPLPPAGPTQPAAPGPAPEREAEPMPPAAGLPPPGAGALVGVVRLAGGSPLVDARVVVTREGEPPEVHELRPDANGQVRLERLQPGRYRLRATHEGYAPRLFEFDVEAGGGAGPFDIVFVEGGTLTVRVLGAGRSPLADRRVTARTEGDREILAMRTDERGEATFRHLAAGQCWVRCSEAADRGQMKTITIQPDREVELTFELSCGFASTALDPDGQPLPGAIVRLIPVDFGGEGYRHVQARTDDLGRFEMRGFPAGDYRPTVQVLKPVAYVSTLDPMTFAEGETRTDELRVPRTLLAGRVTRADTGEPLRGMDATVQAYRVEAAEGGGRPRRVGDHYNAWADDQGRFRLVGLLPGRYEMWAFPRDKSLAHETRYVDFTKGGTLDGVDFALPLRALGTVRLRIREPDGSPATGLTFFVRLDDGVTLTLHEKQVGDGLFELRVEAGTRKIGAYRRGVHTVNLTVEVAEGETIEREVDLSAVESE